MKSRLKNITLIVFCLFTIISIGQDLKPLNELKVRDPIDRQIQLSKDFILNIEPDDDLFNYILTFTSNDLIKLTDTFEITPYGFNFRLFEIGNKRGFLLIIEVEYEFTSDYPIYFLSKNKIVKIGNLNIWLDCDSCDVLNYPLTDIILKGNQNKIEFSFLSDLLLNNGEEQKPYRKDEIIFQYDINKNEFKIKYTQLPKPAQEHFKKIPDKSTDTIKIALATQIATSYFESLKKGDYFDFQEMGNERIHRENDTGNSKTKLRTVTTAFWRF